MKLTVRSNMLPRELEAELPGRLRWLVAAAGLAEVLHVVLQFHGSEPVRGRAAARAVRRIADLPASGQPVLAVAESLTREAAAVLHAHDIRIVALSTDFWTDESYEEIRTIVGSRVKRPNHLKSP